MKEIVDSNNHYVCQVKNNTPNLLVYIQDYISQKDEKSSVVVEEKSHGRHTVWKTKVYEVHDKKLQSNWANLNTFIVINKTVIQKDKTQKLVTTNSISYRISDVKHLSADSFFNGIRGHWGIENRTHWVKDVILNEDKNGIKNENGAVNMATFNTLVINFLRQNINDSIKAAQIFFGQNVKPMCYSIRN